LLDTNIVSNAIKPSPSPNLQQWMSRQRSSTLFIPSLVIAEVWRGILALPSGSKRTGLETWFAGPEGPPQLFQGRILAFDQNAALVWGRLLVDGKAQGFALNPLDMIVAAIAEVNDCIVVTDNEGDFRTVPFINPIRNSGL
jgi:predicted nucleic acid-binding protein